MASLDQVTLVDEHDTPIGAMDKVEAHRGEGKRHRAISVFLFNTRGELLMQQRSRKKIVGALQWANTCCGNVWPGESYEACAHRRLEVELGITGVKLRPLYVFEYHVKCNEGFSEWEIDHVFVGEYDGQVRANPEEVLDFNWIRPKDVRTRCNTSISCAPWFLLMLNEGKLSQFRLPKGGKI